MKLSASKFAREAGVSLPTVLKWMKQGRISATPNGSGGYHIDASELDRVRDHVEAVKGGVTKPPQPGASSSDPLVELAIYRERSEQLALRLQAAELRVQTSEAQANELIEQLRSIRLLADKTSPQKSERRLFGWLASGWR